MAAPLRRTSRWPLQLIGATLATLFGGGLLQPAYADGDSVVITSPQQGSNVYLTGDPANGWVAADPLVVTFAASGSPIVCQIDDQPAVTCSSPVSYEHMTPGPHAVTITAGSAAQTT